MVVWALQDRLDVNCRINNFVSIFSTKPTAAPTYRKPIMTFSIAQWKRMCRYKLPKTPTKIKLFAKKKKWFP